MIHVCKADHARARKWMRQLRRLFVLTFGFMIPCAYCRKTFGRGEDVLSLNPSCRIYHRRCYDHMCFPHDLPDPRQ